MASRDGAHPQGQVRPPRGLYVNQGLISTSGVGAEYHFLISSARASLAAACCGPNYHKSPGNN